MSSQPRAERVLAGHASAALCSNEDTEYLLPNLSATQQLELDRLARRRRQAAAAEPTTAATTLALPQTMAALVTLKVSPAYHLKVVPTGLYGPMDGCVCAAGDEPRVAVTTRGRRVAPCRSRILLLGSRASTCTLGLECCDVALDRCSCLAATFSDVCGAMSDQQDVDVHVPRYVRG